MSATRQANVGLNQLARCDTVPSVRRNERRARDRKTDTDGTQTLGGAATVPVVWTASGENKLRLIAGCWFHDSAKSNSSCVVAGCCGPCGQPPPCGQGGGNA